MLILYQIHHIISQSKYLSGCLILEKNGAYKGILLKDDLDDVLNSQSSFYLDKIIPVEKNEIETKLFKISPSLRTVIPYTSSIGDCFGTLKYEEFVSEFFPEDFTTKISLTEILDHYEYPILIANQFKTILYINKKASDLLSSEAFGKKISDVLLSFTMKIEKDRMTLHRNDEIWTLSISESNTSHITFYIYQFTPNSSEI